jgi:hypothetical protein
MQGSLVGSGPDSKLEVFQDGVSCFDLVADRRLKVRPSDIAFVRWPAAGVLTAVTEGNC